MSENNLTLRQKLVQVYHEIDAVEKGAKNSAQGYSYVRAVDLVNAVRRALKKLNIYAEIQFECLRSYAYTTAKGSVMNAGDVICKITFYDADTADAAIINGLDLAPKHTASGLGSAADSGDKYLYKAQTGALKYALRNAFLIPDENDPEADEDVDHEAQPPKSSAKQKNSGNPAREPVAAPATSQSEEPAAVKSAICGAGSSEIPSGEELEGLRNRFRLLGDDLATGGLKASANPKITIAQKLKAYLLQTTGAADTGKITRSQWNTFFDVVSGVKKSEGGIQSLVKLVNKAALPQEEA